MDETGKKLSITFITFYATANCFLGFSLAPKSGFVIGPRGKHVYDERTSSDKENITTLFAVNALGKF